MRNGVTCKENRCFHSFEAAKECASGHTGGCAACEGIDRWPLSPKGKYPSEIDKDKPKTTKDENDTQKSLINNRDQCPLHKTEDCPCPRCIHSEAISERVLLNVVTFWRCKYPEIGHLTSRMWMIRGKETDSRLTHLNKATWDCPKCHKTESVRYDMKKQIFVCWNCCRTLSFEEGMKIFDGFEGYTKEDKDG